MRTMEKFDAKIIEVIKKCEGKNVILYGYGESGQFLESCMLHPIPER